MDFQVCRKSIALLQYLPQHFKHGKQVRFASSDLYSSPKIRKAQNEQSKHCLSKFEQSLIADLMQFF